MHPLALRLYLTLGQTACHANFGTKTGQSVRKRVKLSEKEDKNSVTILHPVRHSVTSGVTAGAGAITPAATESAVTAGRGSGAG